MAEKINKAGEAISRKFHKQMGYTVMGFILYMIAIFGTICPKGYVKFDLYKVYFMYAGVGILLVVTLFMSLQNLDGGKSAKKKFSLIDILFASTIVCWLIGCALSVDKTSAFMGDDFRRTGYLYMACMMVGAWIVFRYFVYHTVLGMVFSVWCILTNLLSILQYYGIDPFNWQYYRQALHLKSVFGNIDQNAAMCAVQLAVLFTIIMLEKNKVTMCLALVGVAFAVCGGFTDHSAGFFMAAFVVLTAIGIGVRNSELFRRLWYAFVAMYAGFLYQMMNYTHTRDYIYYNEQLTIFLFTHNWVKIGLAILLIVMGAMAFALKNVFDKYGKRISIAWFIFYGLIVLIGFAFIIYVSTHAAKYPEGTTLHSFVVTDARFGSGRGEIWQEGFKAFKEGSFTEKLFGIGFCNISRLKLCDATFAPNGERLADLHNAYLDMLLTCGILGVGTYFATLIALLVSAVKRLKEDGKAMLPLLVVGAYLGVSLINFNLIITTPMAWLALAIGHNKFKAE